MWSNSRMYNRPQAHQQYRSLTEKFQRINLSKRSSMRKSDGKSKDLAYGSFTDKLTTDVPLIYTQEDRRMMREELQKEIVKREMDIIERRSRKSAIFIPPANQLDSVKAMVYPTPKKPLIVRPSTMLYGKFTVAEMERLKIVYQKLRRNNKRIGHALLKPYELEGIWRSRFRTEAFLN